MAIKKKMTLADWHKIVNPTILKGHFIAALRRDYLPSGIAGETDQGMLIFRIKSESVKQLFQNIDVRLKTNFSQAQKKSNFQPIRDPYGWLQETEHFSEKLHTTLLRILPPDSLHFHPSYDWIFKGHLYELTGQHKNSSVFTIDHVKLLILEHYDKDRRKFERLQKIYGSTTNEAKSIKRPRIPESVRIEVWRRDSGTCVKCDSREKLEYDHIIPISKGGGNTARNIELLCEKCNRSKSNKIE
jgi:hypothetical protein